MRVRAHTNTHTRAHTHALERTQGSQSTPQAIDALRIGQPGKSHRGSGYSGVDSSGCSG